MGIDSRNAEGLTMTDRPSGPEPVEGRREVPIAEALSIVVPVHYEGEAVVRLHRALAEAEVGYRELIFVWDLEEDPTVGFIMELRAGDPRVVSCRNTMGRGVLGALKTGVAASTGAAVLVAMGDLSDDLGLVPELFQEWRNGAWVVCPSRWMPGGSMLGGPPLKGFLAKWAGRSLYAIGALPTRDPTNNYKLYDAEFLRSEPVESRLGFEFALEMTYKAQRRGGRIVERPVASRERDQGQSKFRLFRWLPGYLRWYLRAVGDRIRR